MRRRMEEENGGGGGGGEGRFGVVHVPTLPHLRCRSLLEVAVEKGLVVTRVAVLFMCIVLVQPAAAALFLVGLATFHAAGPKDENGVSAFALHRCNLGKKVRPEGGQGTMELTLDNALQSASFKTAADG